MAKWGLEMQNPNNPDEIAKRGLPRWLDGIGNAFGQTLGHFANGLLFREFPEYSNYIIGEDIQRRPPAKAPTPMSMESQGFALTPEMRKYLVYGGIGLAGVLAFAFALKR